MNGAVCRVCSGPAVKSEYSDVARIDVVGAAAQDHEDRSAVVGDGLCTYYTSGVRLERKVEHFRSSNDGFFEKLKQGFRTEGFGALFVKLS